MIHAFVLILLLGDIQQGGEPMYFRNIHTCNYFAKEIVKRYGNGFVPDVHKAIAYCKPTYIKEDIIGLY